MECLDKVFSKNHDEYQRIKKILNSEDFLPIYRELYAGGKQTHGNGTLSRQMILGDVVEYIFTGRAYYYAAKSEENFKTFAKLILYCVNQLLLFDIITINYKIRKLYIKELEQKIDSAILYEKEGDQKLANEIKNSDIVIWQNGWEKYDDFIDSLLPKTLGSPKELVVFLELIRLNKGIVIPLLLIQRLFGGEQIIVPPDFLFLKRNKEIFGIEVGYAKEEQSREFSLRTSIPTFAVDLANHMHNRCPKCGQNILYCDVVIEKYANGTLLNELDSNGILRCSGRHCMNPNGKICKFANYYGQYKGSYFYGRQKAGNEKKKLHYHAACVINGTYNYRGKRKRIKDHMNEFFAQIPQIEGLENL